MIDIKDVLITMEDISKLSDDAPPVTPTMTTDMIEKWQNYWFKAQCLKLIKWGTQLCNQHAQSFPGSNVFYLQRFQCHNCMKELNDITNDN